MPLLLITGGPSCGKTTIRERIRENLVENGYSNAEVVTDESNPSFSRAIYSNSQKEREHRDIIRSEVQRSLTKDRLVICDSLNYIKGFRYELYCIGKLVQTTYAVVYCDADERVCKWLNSQKDHSKKYEDNIIKDLLTRYELPESKNKWDSPLFTLKLGLDDDYVTSSELVHSERSEYPSPVKVEIPFEKIFTCLFKEKTLVANLSTQDSPISSSNFLHDLDRVTREINSSFFLQQKNAVSGSQLSVPYCVASGEKIVFKRHRSLADLARLRRQFLTYIKTHPVDGVPNIASLYINFVNADN